MGELCIGICDDQQEIVDKLGELVRQIYGGFNCKEWVLCEYTSPVKLLEEIEKIDVLFLDVEMEEMDGIEVGRRIRGQNPECKIIIATSQIDRYKEAFFIEALRFITKPFLYDEVREALAAAIEEKPGEAEIEAYRDRVSFNIKEKDITMIRAYNGYVEIMAGNSIFRKDTSLNSLEKQLDNRIFFRVNRQYLVNFKYISSYSKNKAVVGKKTFVISVRRQKEFLKKYTEYDLRYS
ncbi:LytR/AlgR family response regulator transcription factor [Butyrivibrio sp. X503]|uniref:LytR/AlgR family response regulator transcription factor n=1 Tax=Butyrivibrio sp. X503 TaxID=2364878 RepID=UPI001314F114|nr:LytTR family DNA-binding domain-containing protein [Butyrivibrio sp. X503]